MRSPEGAAKHPRAAVVSENVHIMIARILRLPAVMLLACATGGAVMQRLVPLSTGLGSFAARGAAGAGLFVAATALASAALLRMRRKRTTFEPEGQPAALVSDGPFAWSRNPIYLALLLILVALSVATDVVWFALGTPILWLLLDRIVIPREEKVLLETFGEEYVRYRREVRRWL